MFCFQYVTLPPGPVPGPSPKYAYGNVQVKLEAGVMELKEVLPKVTNKWPLTFEDLSVFNGIVIYNTTLPFTPVSVL